MRRRIAWFAVVFTMLAACGETYIDTSVTVPNTSPDATQPTFAPVVADTPLDQLLVEIETLMSTLDEQVIDNRGADATMARIDELWREAELQIRRDNPDDVYNFSQTIDLARIGVQRRRPADISKGYKLLTDVVDAYLGR